ncbi:MAG: acetyl-CoA carboxylase biotin carboxylase subunit [Nocardioidaceae bacterium]
MTGLTEQTPIRRVLVANRGEVAVRIVRACRDAGVESVVAFSEPDRGSLATRLSDRAICIGPATAADSYLNRPALLATALGTGCDAVHPGYGFLAENADFAEECASHGLRFVGPRPQTTRVLGDKAAARRTAADLGVPVLPGGIVDEDAVTVAEEVGLPLLIKASAGGGGRGLRRVDHATELPAMLAACAEEARTAFGDPTLYVERFLTRARHIEVQIFGDAYGTVIHLFERDCTTQRRYQKLVEEAPSPALSPSQRRHVTELACRLAREMKYEGAGTVEFLFDPDTDEFFFMEMNTRLQVEHPVTEVLTSLDLVRMQLEVAAGMPLALTQQDVTSSGHVVEFRINAEDASRGFAPRAGTVSRWQLPLGPWVRVDTHIEQGGSVPPFYDSLLAKVVVCGADRAEALARSRRALRDLVMDGVPSTLPFHTWLLDQPDFIGSALHTTWVDTHWEGSGQR